MKMNDQTAQKYVTILGIKVLSTNTTEVLSALRDKIAHNSEFGSRSGKFYIVTPNPELILASTKNNELKIALNSSDFPVPDAIGLSQAAKYLALKAPANKIARTFVAFFQGLIVGGATFFNKDWLTESVKPIKGRILFIKLIELANSKGWKVFFLGGDDQEAQMAAKKLRLNYKTVKIEAFAGPKLTVNGVPAAESDRSLQKEAIKLINKFSPELLFVAFGNPKQEIWIHKNLKSLNVGGAMAVGGTFRYAAGVSRLPPKWMEKYGLEWVWRLITEPYRFKRIWNAFPIFPLRIFWFKISRR